MVKKKKIGGFLALILLLLCFLNPVKTIAIEQQLMVIDEPVNGGIIEKSDILVRGWALNASGIKEVNVLVDGKLNGNAQILLSRPDVYAIFPNYIDAKNSGYSYLIKKETIDIGTHTIRVQAVGKDGSIQYMDKQIEIKNLPLRGNIDEPIGTEFTKNIAVRGWAVNPAGVKAIKLYVDDVLKGTVEQNVVRTDVNTIFPGYPSGDNSGFATEIDINTISEGSHSIKVSAEGNDGTIYLMERSVVVKKLPRLANIDDPLSIIPLGYDNKVRGWALDPSGVKQIKIYIDNVYKGDAQLGLQRMDVNSVFPGYINGENCGYVYPLLAADLMLGQHTLKIEALGNDGGKQTVEKVFNVVDMPARINLDEPTATSFRKTSIVNLRGWAINAFGVKEVKVYLDGNLLGNAAYGYDRRDVANVFSSYMNSDKSEFRYSLDLNTVAEGTHNVQIVSVGNDGKEVSVSKNIEVKQLPSYTQIDDPSQATIFGDSSIRIRGWALNASVVKTVKIYVNNEYMGDAVIGQYRPDLKTFFSEYQNCENAGYYFDLDLTKRESSVLNIKVVAIGNDGTTNTVEKTVQFKQAPPIPPLANIDDPVQGSAFSTSSSSVLVRGWSLDYSGVKSVEVYLDGIYKGQATIGQSRIDVGYAYPNYVNSSNSGFQYNMDIRGISAGTHTVTVRSIGLDDFVKEDSRQFRVGIRIVIDPGHNYGGNDGAYSYFNGITYCERDLNMQVALKLKLKLQSLGYEIIMTRTPFDITYESSADSLAKRVSIANNSGADLFISIHHDSSISTTAKGISTHWSSWRPNIDTSGTYTVNDITYDSTPSAPALASRDISQRLVNNLAALGYVNRGSIDHNLYVTRNTNIPSVLIECGFISNPEEAARSADPYNQQSIADTIANTVNMYYKR